MSVRLLISDQAISQSSGGKKRVGVRREGRWRGEEDAEVSQPEGYVHKLHVCRLLRGRVV